jgi:hypothetical protein
VPIGTSIEIWFQDEMRLGQKNGCVRQWAARGKRPSQPADQRYANAYVFGADCPARDTGAALVLPEANTWAMQQNLDATSKLVAPDSHAVTLLDNAGWHKTKRLKWPTNISPLFIPPGYPDLNAAENISAVSAPDLSLQSRLANYEAILDAASDAWNRLLAEGGRINSIATRDWAVASR